MMQSVDLIAGAVVLLLVVGAISLLAEWPITERFFRIPPAVLWIYLVPTVISTLGLIPRKNPLYGVAVDVGLPSALLLLLLAADLGAVLRLGPRALGMMLAGSAGVVLAGPTVLLLVGSWLPPDAWSALGTLSASWIGGSVNMVAVKESIGTPDAVLLEVIVIDAVVAYGWMALLVLGVPLQTRFDRWNRCPADIFGELARHGEQKTSEEQAAVRAWRSLPTAGGLLALGVGGALLARLVAASLPEVPGAISTYTWTVLIVTAVGVVLSLTRLRSVGQQHGGAWIGTFLLYLVLASIGARADLSSLAASATRLLLGGALCMLVHGAVLLLAARLLRAPLFLWAAASQANIGGPVSAPAVAAAYQPELAHVGLLLAILGNVGGTYLGIAAAGLCRLAAGA